MRKSKIREWRERAGSYGEYKDKERYLTQLGFQGYTAFLLHTPI